jgi:nanoRNase/pAp phosphatase (c-di-AMP/oligoRNAs hydrolase)
MGYKTPIPAVFPKGVQGTIILDTNNLESVGAFGDKIINSGSSILFIDHHAQQNLKGLDALLFNDEEYNSTASIIYEVLKKLDFNIDKSSAVALLHGIISDSSEFHNATPLTFRQVADLLDTTDVTYSEIMSSFMQKVPVQNRFNLIKDICASKTEIDGNYLITFGVSSIHANLTAEMAIKLGADASLFWKEEEKEVSISGRLRPPLDKKLSIHLGKMMQEVSGLLNGNGGGHACAAGAYGPNRDMTDTVVNKLLDELRNKFKHG